MPVKTHSKPRQARTPKKKEKTRPPPDPLRQKFRQLQMAVLARSLTPIKETIDIKDRADLTAFQIKLMELNFKRELNAIDFQAHNQAVRNLRELMTELGEVAPPGIDMITIDQLLAVVRQLPLEMQDKFVEALRAARIRGQVQPTPTPGEVHAVSGLSELEASEAALPGPERRKREAAPGDLAPSA